MEVHGNPRIFMRIGMRSLHQALRSKCDSGSGTPNKNLSFWHWCWSYIKNRHLSRITFYYQLWEIDSSKREIGKLIRGVKNGTIQLKRIEYNASREKDILSIISFNGPGERQYSWCCICKKLLKKGSSNKSCRNKHISKHYLKGDLRDPHIIYEHVQKFNLINGRR